MKDTDALAHAMILRLIAKAIRENRPELLEETAQALEEQFDGKR